MFLQIRIVRDTHADEKPNKKKKPHRGYAFIVFEREKDMRGNTTIDLPINQHLEPVRRTKQDSPLRLWPSSLPFSFPFPFT